MSLKSSLNVSHPGRVHGNFLKNSLPPDAIHFKEHSDYVRYVHHYLTLEAPIMSAADGNFLQIFFFPNQFFFLHVNCLLL